MIGKPGLQHDVAVAAAKASLDVVAPCPRVEEQGLAWKLLYEIALAALQKYEALMQRENARLHPSEN
jgi:hypothetical protein